MPIKKLTDVGPEELFNAAYANGINVTKRSLNNIPLLEKSRSTVIEMNGGSYPHYFRARLVYDYGILKGILYESDKLLNPGTLTRVIDLIVFDKPLVDHKFTQMRPDIYGKRNDGIIGLESRLLKPGTYLETEDGNIILNNDQNNTDAYAHFKWDTLKDEAPDGIAGNIFNYFKNTFFEKDASALVCDSLTFSPGYAVNGDIVAAPERNRGYNIQMQLPVIITSDQVLRLEKMLKGDTSWLRIPQVISPGNKLFLYK
jgi:hypothetical protein